MGVEALAISAILVVLVASTAVSAIPIAAAVVVTVVTIAIAAETVHSTSPLTLHAGVLASTIRAVFVNLIGTTAVTAVPSTSTVIVSIVAVFITAPNLDTGLGILLQGRAGFLFRSLVASTFASRAVATELGF